MTITYQAEDQICRCSYLAPSVSFASIHSARKSVESLDVTPGGLAVSCDTTGKLKVWTTDSAETRVDIPLIITIRSGQRDYGETRVDIILI